MLLSLENIYKSFGAASVLEDVSLSLEADSRVGLIGVNGAGKTTLLSIITGELSPDSGSVSLASGADIGYLRQSAAAGPGTTIYEELRNEFSSLLQMEEELCALRARMADMDPNSPDYDALAHRLADIQGAFELGGGYDIDVRIETVLTGMGFSGYDRKMPVSSLSGGERTRLSLARLLLRRPALLILDEPTNHLDFRTLMWLEDYLINKYKGALLVVTHDRYFLDKVTDGIAELEHRRLNYYKGGYSSYAQQKEERAERYRKEYEAQQREIAKMRDFAARNIARASTSGMAKSRLAAIERMDIMEAPKAAPKTARLRFEYDREPVKDVLHIEGLTLRAGGQGRELAACDELHILRGERVGVIGDNGTGKSTFLKAIQGLIKCEAALIKWGDKVKPGYYDQDNMQLHAEKTALADIWDSFPQMREQDVRSLLASVLLTGDDVYKRIGDLSGGERAKVALAKLSLQRANVLILDEPTNHLDLATKDIIDAALSGFTGTLIMVSHDRYLLSRVPTRIVEISDGSVRQYRGGFEEYLKAVENGEASPKEAQPKEEKPAREQRYRSKRDRANEVENKRRLARLEADIESCEADIARIEAELARKEVMEDYQRLCGCIRELEEKRTELSALMEEWAGL